MKRLLVIFSLFFTLICLASPIVVADEALPGIPGIEACDSIVLRTSEGWWLRVHRDDSGSYGFGTDIGRVEAEVGAFVFKEVYEETSKAAATERKSAEGPYVAVSYYLPESNSAQEYYMTSGRKYAAGLFRSARENAASPTNDFEERQHKKIEELWKKGPFKP